MADKPNIFQNIGRTVGAPIGGLVQGFYQTAAPAYIRRREATALNRDLANLVSELELAKTPEAQQQILINFYKTRPPEQVTEMMNLVQQGQMGLPQKTAQPKLTGGGEWMYQPTDEGLKFTKTPIGKEAEREEAEKKAEARRKEKPTHKDFLDAMISAERLTAPEAQQAAKQDIMRTYGKDVFAGAGAGVPLQDFISQKKGYLARPQVEPDKSELDILDIIGDVRAGAGRGTETPAGVRMRLEMLQKARPDVFDKLGINVETMAGDLAAKTPPTTERERLIAQLPPEEQDAAKKIALRLQAGAGRKTESDVISAIDKLQDIATKFKDDPKSQVYKDLIVSLQSELAAMRGGEIVTETGEISPVQKPWFGRNTPAKTGPIRRFKAKERPLTVDEAPSLQDQPPEQTPKQMQDFNTLADIIKRYKKENPASRILPATFVRYPKTRAMLLTAESDVQDAVLSAIEQGYTDDAIINALQE